MPHRPSPVAEVTTGMRVVDADGEQVGTVDIVRLGDPNAVTVQAPATDAGGTLAEMVSSAAVEEPDVPADAAARLLRRGYVKVDGDRPLDGAFYVEADQIADVGQDVVRLNVAIADLTPEE